MKITHLEIAYKKNGYTSTASKLNNWSLLDPGEGICTTSLNPIATGSIIGTALTEDTNQMNKVIINILFFVTICIYKNGFKTLSDFMAESIASDKLLAKILNHSSTN